MISDDELAQKLATSLRAQGYECGQRFKGMGAVVRDIKAQMIDESEQSLRTRVERVVKVPGYGFKTRQGASELEVSASSECGNRTGGMHN